jgi:ABC-type nitrate/sulfonate/bicarbonate transport system permease component
MADRNVTTEEMLLDIKLADASALFEFYLNQEKKILGLLAVIVFLSLWEFMGGAWSVCNPIGGLRNNPMFKPMLMSAPSLIGKAAFDLFSSGEIYNDLYVNGSEFFWGYFLAVAVAIPFGIGMGWYKKMSHVFGPFVNAMKATPRVALLPLIIIWLGIGIPAKVGIIFLVAARSFGASEWQVFRSVVCPSTVPFILTGLRLGVGSALVGVLVGELYVASAGIGFMITVAAQSGIGGIAGKNVAPQLYVERTSRRAAIGQAPVIFRTVQY